MRLPQRLGITIAVLAFSSPASSAVVEDCIFRDNGG